MIVFPFKTICSTTPNYQIVAQIPLYHTRLYLPKHTAVHLPAAAPSGPSGQRLSGWTSPLPGEGGGQIIGGPARTCKNHETPLAFGNLTHARGLPYFSHELWRKTWNTYGK